MSAGGRPWKPQAVRAAPYLAHLVATLWLFSGPLLGGRVFYFRDIPVHYHPNEVFVWRSFREGLWPLWNPTSDAGAPFLMGYPFDLALIGLGGPQGAVRLDLPLHALVALCGMTALARVQQMGSWGAWLAGAVYGGSGYFLSQPAVPVFQAAAWAPWVLACWWRLLAAPRMSTAGVLGALGALQVSTAGVEVVVQTALIALLLLPRRPPGSVLGRLAVAAGVALLLAAPVLLGTRTVLQGTQRGEGFTPQQALAYSAPFPVLLESVLPRFLGDVHTFSEVGYWGQPFFSEGFPYVLSLYLGPAVLALALRGGSRRLWLLAALGVLLSLGRHGPLETVLAHALFLFRGPVKFFLLATFAMSLLAGRGLDRTLREGSPAPWPVVVPGALVLLVGVVAALAPDQPGRALGTLLPALAHPRGRWVVEHLWPAAFLVSGLLALAAGLALRLVPRLAPVAGILAALDLLAVNGSLNPATDPSFYVLRPEVSRLVERARAQGDFRWFSYGVANSPPLHWAATVAQRNSDVWLYYIDRQSLLPRNHVLEGLEAAFDEDRVGWAPEGASLSGAERSPLRFREHHARLRMANVRWVLSFHPLPPDLVQEAGQAALPEVAEPLRLYELRDPLPRALWVPLAVVLPDRARLRQALEDPRFDPRRAVLVEAPARETPRRDTATVGSVVVRRADAHHLEVRTAGAPGYVVVLEGHHPYWRARAASGEVELVRANGRYLAFWTPGGPRTYLLAYEPPWLGPALAASAAGALLAFLLWVTRFTRRSRTLDSPAAAR